MQLFDITLPTPAENLAGDEALLNACETSGGAALRFWESPAPFVVVGYGNEIAREVNVAACAASGVSVLRRCSGGGTVLQGPGCWNYALVLDIAADAALATVAGANGFILHRTAAALACLLGEPVERCGDTDLVWRGRKFSGNAQRRRRTHLLFHGTLLLGFDLALAVFWRRFSQLWHQRITLCAAAALHHAGLSIGLGFGLGTRGRTDFCFSP